MKMRALLAGLLVAVLCLSLVACGKTDDPVTPESSDISEEPSAPIVEPDVSGETSADISGEISGGDVSGEPDVSGETTIAGETTTTKPGQTTKKTTAKPTKKGETTKTGGKKTTAKPTKKGETTAKTTAKTTKKGETTAKTTTAGKTTTKRSSKSKVDPNTVFRQVTIKESTTKLEDTVSNTFKGKKFTAITWVDIATSSYKNELNKIAAQYGCTIEQKDIPFESVRPLLATSLANGDAYDIIRMHGSWYPRVLIAGLLQPLEDSFTSADVVTDSSTVGIDMDKSAYFGWNKHLYGITTYDDSPIYYFYYNKKMLNGANDPWTLYNAGQWTWQKMKDIASHFKGTAGQPFFGDHAFCYKFLSLANNTHLVKETENKDGSVTLSVSISSNTAFSNALKMTQGLLGRGTGTGLYAPESVLKGDGDQGNMNNFLAGNIACWPSECNRFQALYKRVSKEGVGLDNNVDNLGVAPVPLGPDNTAGRYPAGWLTGFACGRGSDATAPKLVAALCKYHSTYKEQSSESALDKAAAAADESVRSKMHKFYKKLDYCDFGYGTADGTMDNVLYSIEQSVITGGDITATLKKYDSVAEKYLKDSILSQ